MKFAFLLVAIIVIVSLMGTVLVARNTDENYGNSTKQNVTNLSVIYIVLFLILLIGVAWYTIVIL
ncbi:hypothetical protein ACFQZ1_12050 [Bacillus sp. CGMCC 1.60114]|uniref:hypothetical protein n=1 Tax=Bacillus TaxID=1386 RepID=UPI00363A55B1